VPLGVGVALLADYLSPSSKRRKAVRESRSAY
jgi:hypothetical protein